ncbi:MAG TPA: hypothetical protein PKW98_02750 [Candidatus Wallbacteria bacterium]|mgnify:FL=1|nr:MAG: hypothetical protein BWY32_03050 [bacterium ADurb.Bin243]HOD39827.1 hypothetical protein [Candidatus Wallbacteria bacterium]HPG56713.1 hypothetical protein [Candidatus Wallbacteria bacterium]
MKKHDGEKTSEVSENGGISETSGGGDISNVHFDRIYLAVGVCAVLFILAWLFGM